MQHNVRVDNKVGHLKKKYEYKIFLLHLSTNYKLLKILEEIKQNVHQTMGKTNRRYD
jgi:hypothetical protein